MSTFELHRVVSHNPALAHWRVLTSLLVAFNLAIIAFVSFTPDLTATIDKSAIVPEIGAAYSASLPHGPGGLYQMRSDTNASPLRSRLTLTEDGRPIGPAHVVHDDIRAHGGGRYSHWGYGLIFSTPDGSDPRVNSRTYVVASPTAVRTPLRIALLAVLLLVHGAYGVVFRKVILELLRRRPALLLGGVAIAATAVAALCASGLLGTQIVGHGGPPQDAALCLQVAAHACLGCLLAIGIWAAGAGLTLLVQRNARAGLGEVLIPAFPLSLALLAALAATALAAPHGRIIAVLLWIGCLLPLLNWRPDRRQVSAALKAGLAIIPLALAFGVWLALFWHGPTATLSGTPSGDLTDYAGTIWSLHKQAYPLLNRGYEGGVPRSYFNNLYSALGATLLHLPGFDPFAYLIAGGATSYIFFTALMLHLYLADRPSRSADWFALALLLSTFIAAARYPYWVVETIPLVFTPALTISVWWMTERSKDSLGWMIAATLGGLIGSMLSKVVTAIVLVPLGAARLWRQFGQLPRMVQAAAFVIGCVFAAYCAAMLWRFMPVFTAIAPLGPEGHRDPRWFVQWRDLATVALAILVWFVAEAPVALALSIGFASFLIFSFLFFVNFICATIVVGLLIFTSPVRTITRWLVLLALMLALPAPVISDPTGLASGVVWTVCLGGSVLVAVLTTTRIEGGPSHFPFRASAAMAATTLAIAALLLVGTANGHLIFNSGWPLLKPELRDIWSKVRELTPPNSLIFTDQVDESTSLVGGWNTYAFSGQRQLYLSSYYTAIELRTNPARLHEELAINEAVLNGTRKPADVRTQRGYDSMFAVVSVLRAVPPGWTKLYGNTDYALFKMAP